MSSPPTHAVHWLRAYHTRRFSRVDTMLKTLDAAGVLTPTDDAGTPAFYDIQALAAHHFATARGPVVRISGPMKVGDEVVDVGELRGSLRVLLHASGFLVLRLTVASDDNPQMADWSPEAYAAASDMTWQTDQELEWRIDRHTVVGGIRNALNLFFLTLHEALMGRDPREARLAELAVEGDDGCRRLHALAAANELSHPYPVTYGAHLEFASEALIHSEADRRTFVGSILAQHAQRSTAALQDVESDQDDVSWYFFENQSIVIRGEGGELAGVDAIDADRTRLIEFLCLRRGALRSIQRDTQRVLSEIRTVSRRRVGEWQLLLATTTDDYVLHDRIGGILVQLNNFIEADSRLRNVRELEAQVRRNIDAFSTRLELASQGTSTVVGALFGVVAAVIGIGSVARTFAAERYHVTVNTLADVHPWLSAGIDLGITVLAFLVTLVVIRRSSRRVPPLRPEE